MLPSPRPELSYYSHIDWLSTPTGASYKLLAYDAWQGPVGTTHLGWSMNGIDALVEFSALFSIPLTIVKLCYVAWAF